MHLWETSLRQHDTYLETPRRVVMHDYKSCPPPMESAVRREGWHVKMIENINSHDNNFS